MWDFYLQDRTADSIITVLSTFLGLLKNQYNLKPQVIECDNELTSQKPRVKRYIESLHIRIEPSPPYTQALNGGAERLGGVVKQKIRSMRASSKLPSSTLERDLKDSSISTQSHSKIPISMEDPIRLVPHLHRPKKWHSSYLAQKAKSITPSSIRMQSLCNDDRRT